MLSPKQQKSVDEKRQKIMTAYARLGSAAKVAAELGMPSSSVRRLVSCSSTKPAPLQKTTTGRSLAEFSAAYNKDEIVPKKIRAGLAQLADGWETETVFLKIAGVSLADSATYREEFSAHIVLIERTRRLWAGTKQLADKMRALVP